jgi:hypothetical protein
MTTVYVVTDFSAVPSEALLAVIDGECADLETVRKHVENISDDYSVEAIDIENLDSFLDRFEK